MSLDAPEEGEYIIGRVLEVKDFGATLDLLEFSTMLKSDDQTVKNIFSNFDNNINDNTKNSILNSIHFSDAKIQYQSFRLIH